MKSFLQMLLVVVSIIVVVLINCYTCVSITYQCHNCTQNCQASLRTISSRLVALHEPFNASKSRFASVKCRRDMSKYLAALENLELWAVRMYDSSAKMPSGVLSGNINQLGDYDECMQSRYDDGRHHIKPQYCLAYLQPEVIDGSMTLQHYHRMIQSNYIAISNFDDPGDFFPRLSSINWAICLPATCTHKDVEDVLTNFATNLTQGIGIQLKVRVDKEMCQRPINSKISLGSKFALIMVGILLLISSLSTIYDYKTKIQNPWFVVVSMRKNLKILFSLKRPPNDIQSIHGIRFFLMLMLIMAHKIFVGLQAPYMNRTNMSEVFGKWWTVIGRCIIIYTEPFFMISGLLATHTYIGSLQKGNTINIKQEYISRFIRVIPPLLGAIYFSIFIVPLLGSGPLWNLVVTNNLDICKYGWWKNLLFIQNYFGMENICYGHSHHMATDTQLFILVPFMSLLLWNYPKVGVASLAGIAGVSTIGRYLITIEKRLSYVPYYKISVKQLLDTFNYLYLIPAYRITVYIMGVFLGYLLKTRKDLKLSETQLKIGWLINTILLIVAIFGAAPMVNVNYKYNPTDAAIYVAYAPIAMCSFFGWIIFTSHLGYTSKLSRFLSWRGFLITTRLSYVIYLVQLPLFFFNVGKLRHSGYFNLVTDLMDFYEMLQLVVLSILLMILIETPFRNIYKIIYPSQHKVLSQVNGSKEK